MIKKIQQLLAVGLHSELTSNEEKQVKLLNFICVTWYAIILLFLVTDYLYRPEYISFVLIHLYGIAIISLVLYLHHKQKYVAARLILITQFFTSTLAFAIVAEAGTLIELYFVLVPIFAVIFLRKKAFQYAILLVVLATVVWLGSRKESINGLGDHLPSLFVVIFVAFIFFRYIKEITTENELRLIEQKNEIRKLYNFQNRFFNNIAHEIRTPLTIIKGGIVKAEKEGASAKTIQSLTVQTGNIQDIVRDVLDLTKMDSNNFVLNHKSVNISALVYRTYYSFSSNFAQKKIEYKFLDNTRKNVMVLGDENYLSRAVANLFTNALKYTDENQQVSIFIEQDDHHIWVKVTDHGIGIPASDLDRVFNRFYQSDNDINRAGGSGIGLSFTKEIIEKHDGNISVISTAGEGSTFTILLPIDHLIDPPADNTIEIQETESENITSTDQPNIQHKKGAHILLVEDHDDMRNYLKEVLIGYQVTEAKHGLEALDYLTENKVDFVITDYMMPKMDGNELVQSIQKKGINVPILMLTARADASVKLDMLRLGIDDYMTKPFEEEELLIRIEKGLENYTSQRHYVEEERIPPAELKANKFIEDLKVYIEGNCTQSNFTVATICDDFALSQSSLYRKIKSLTGLTSKAFITEIRLQKARQLTEENPSLSAKEVGFEVGFANYTHLRKIYLKRFGKSLLD